MQCLIANHCWGLITSCMSPWWRHQMETFSASLAICAGNSPVTGEFSTQRPVTRSFDVFFLICAWTNDWVNNGEAGDLGRHRAHCDVTVMKPLLCWTFCQSRTVYSFCIDVPVASNTKEVNPRLAKRPLKTNGLLADLGLTSLVQETTGHPEYL